MGTLVPLRERTRMRRRCSPWQLIFIALLGTAALLARIADGYAWCQEYWNWDGKRHSSADGRRWPANDGVVITYINGIFHSVPDWESITHQLQTMFGHEVRPFYNPSSGWWITDASKAGYHLLRKPANDTVAKALGQHLAQAVEDVGRGRVLHIAHSGGALITYLAAQHHLSRRQRDKIDVLTFGGARSITRKYFSGRVVNYYARNDPLVKLDRRAAELMKLTNNTKFQEINEKHNTTFIFLEGRARQFVLDHSLEGPTYQHALRKEAKAFRRAHFGPLSPLSWDYEHSLMRLARKKMAQLSGLHDFFNTELFGLRYFRKSVAHLTGFHGFFSGKNRAAKGVAVSVIGTGIRTVGAGETAAEGEEASGARWWWPWGRQKGSSSDDGSEGVAALGAVNADAPDSGDRFWLGFRWSRRQRKDLEDEHEVAGGVTDFAAPALLIPEGGEGGPESTARSRWGRVRGVWRFGRPAESEAVGAAAAAAAAVLEEQDNSSEEIADGEEKAEGAIEEELVSSPESSSRPWLSIGWTPWGGRAKDGGSGGVVPSTSSGEGDAGAGAAVGTADGDGRDAVVASTAPPAVAGDTEGKRRADSTVDESQVAGSPAEAEAVSPPRDEVSYIRRWWPGNSSSSSSSSSGNSSTAAQDEAGEVDGTATADPEGGSEASKVDGTRVGEKAGSGDVEVAAGAVESPPLQLREQPQSEPEETSVGELGEGAEQAKSVSLLRRWWPASKQSPTSPAPSEEDGRSLNATQVGVGLPSVLEVDVLGSVDGDRVESLENRGTKDLPKSLPGVQLPKLASVRQQDQDQEEEGGGEEKRRAEVEIEQTLPAVSTSGVRQDMSAGQAAASFAQRFWEVFSNKPAVDVPPPDDATASVASGPDGRSDASMKAGGEPEREEQTGAVVGPGETADSQGAEESIVGEVIVAEDFLRPSATATDLPSPPSAETKAGVDEEKDEEIGDGGGGRLGGGGGGGAGGEEKEDCKESFEFTVGNAEGRDDGEALAAEVSGGKDGDVGGEVEDDDHGPRQRPTAVANAEGREGGEALNAESGEEVQREGPEVEVEESNPAPPATSVRKRVSNAAGAEVPR